MSQKRCKTETLLQQIANRKQQLTTGVA